MLLFFTACVGGDGGGNSNSSSTKAAVAAVAEGPVVQIYSNGNDGGVINNPTSPTNFTITDTCKITLIMDYHFNNGAGAGAGTIGLKDGNGKVIGTWAVTVRSNVYWDAKPNVVIGPGTYTVVDSDTGTWSQNNQSRNQGMSIISGIWVNKSNVVASAPASVTASAVASASATPTQEVKNADPDWWKKQPELKQEDQAVHSVMTGFEKALTAKDMKQSLTYFSPDAQVKYSQVLAKSPDLLPQMAKDMQNATLSFLSLDTTMGRIAEYSLIVDGKTYYIVFIKIDGKWVLKSF